MAKSFVARLRGLIGRKAFRPGEAMLFPACNDIHMWFMSIPIDVVFLREEKCAEGARSWKISSAHSDVRPWKPLPLRDGRAHSTLELPAGTIRKLGLAAGDAVCIA